MERSVLDREKLAKVLALTTSNLPHEALAAICRANRMIAAANMTWDKVLAQPSQPAPAFQSAHAVHVDIFRHGFASPEFYKDGEEWRIRVKR